MNNQSSEFRYCELRADESSRAISGIAIRYNEVASIAGIYRELFRAGSFGNVGTLDVLLNVQHERSRPVARTGGGGLQLMDSDTELRIYAELPLTREADDVLTLIRNRVIRGLSVEFKPIQQQFVSGIREINSALLKAVALVDTPAYEQSVVKARYREFLDEVKPEVATKLNPFYL